MIAISKLLLNSLLGRFGLSINKPITKIVDVDKLNELQISSPRKILNIQEKAYGFSGYYDSNITNPQPK